MESLSMLAFKVYVLFMWTDVSGMRGEVCIE